MKIPLEDDDLHGVRVEEHPGYSGMFTRNQAEGAIPNGTRVVKCEMEEGNDAHAVGAQAVVLGSINVTSVTPPPGVRRADYFYFVEWDDMPAHAVGVMSWKIKRLHDA